MRRSERNRIGPPLDDVAPPPPPLHPPPPTRAPPPPPPFVGQRDTVALGPRKDLYSEGSEWGAHSMWPCDHNDVETRVTIGGPQCKLPYSASIFNISAMSYGALSGNASTPLAAVVVVAGGGCQWWWWRWWLFVVAISSRGRRCGVSGLHPCSAVRSSSSGLKYTFGGAGRWWWLRLCRAGRVCAQPWGTARGFLPQVSDTCGACVASNQRPRSVPTVRLDDEQPQSLSRRVCARTAPRNAKAGTRYSLLPPPPSPLHSSFVSQTTLLSPPSLSHLSPSPPSPTVLLPTSPGCANAKRHACAARERVA